jgi:hypothetical protein
VKKDKEYTSEEDGHILMVSEQNGIDNVLQAAMAVAPVDHQGPEKRNGRTRENSVRQNVGQNETEAGSEAQPGPREPHSPEPGRQKPGNERKYQAVRGAAMEGAPVPLKNNPEDDVYVRQVGKNENSEQNLPSPRT